VKRSVKIISTSLIIHENKIPPSLSQAFTTHLSNVFTLILSLSEGRAGIAWVPSNNMLSPPPPRRYKAPLSFAKCFPFLLLGAGVAQSVSQSDYGLDDRAIGVRFSAEAKDLYSNFCVQTGSEAHPASCTMGTGSSFSGAKARPGRDADHSPHLV
jgi:hypothetical protein